MSADGAGNVGDRRGEGRGGDGSAGRPTSPTREGVVDRRVIPDRRALADRKNKENRKSAGPGSAGDNPVGTGTGAVSGLERRRGPGRRLSDFTRSAEEGEMTQEQFLFLMAIDEFKKANGRTFPSWTDVLEVIRLLGYRKTMASELKLRAAEDWREPADSPANVRPKGWEKRAGMSRDAA